MSAGKGEEEPMWALLLFVGALIAAGWIIWSMFQTQILEGLRYVRMVELFVIGLFDDRAKPCVDWLRLARIGDNVLPSTPGYQAAVACFGADTLIPLSAREALQYYNLTPTSMGVISEYVARYMRWVTAAVGLWVAYYAILVSKRNGFRVRYNLESFIKIQAKIWPVIAPIVNFNPSKANARILGQAVPDKLPPFAEALSPEEWLSFHRVPVTNGIPDREVVRRAFLLQLGPRWTGVGDTPPHVQALLAAFALKGAQKREECDALMGRLALCWSEKGGLKLTASVADEIRKILKDPEMGGRLLECTDKHAYRTTAVLGALRWGRFMGGVLAPASFLWLRAVDRNLWYALNNLGRRSFHTEGAGSMAHFMAELAAQKALPIPRIDTAIVTLNQYLAANTVVIPPREGGKKVTQPT